MVGYHSFHSRQTAELAHDAVLSAGSEDRLVQDRQLYLFYLGHAGNHTRMTLPNALGRHPWETGRETAHELTVRRAREENHERE